MTPKYKIGQTVKLVKDVVSMYKPSIFEKYFGTTITINKIEGYDYIRKQYSYVVNNIGTFKNIGCYEDELAPIIEFKKIRII